jgi:hypothetical protein
MAKKKSASGVNKSQAIRDALQANPGKAPKAIAAILAEQGLVVTPQYVSVVKSTTGKRKNKTVKVRKLPKGGAQSPIAAAIAFVRAVGGLAAAKQVLAHIEEIQSL